MSEKNTYRLNYTIKGFECNCFGEVSFPTLIAIMMLASREQEKVLNVPSLIDWKGVTWIIVQNSITINRLPRYEEEITIETEPIAYNKFFTYRRYTVYDQKGEQLVEALTIFSMIDVIKRKLVPIEQDILHYYDIETEQTVPRVEKMAQLLTEVENQHHYRVRVLDIDYNKHVNNTKYFEWMLDTMGMDFLEQYRLKRVLIKYEQEVRPNSTVTSTMQTIVREKCTLKTAHVIWDEMVRCCQINVDWELKGTES